MPDLTREELDKLYVAIFEYDAMGPCDTSLIEWHRRRENMCRVKLKDIATSIRMAREALVLKEANDEAASILAHLLAGDTVEDSTVAIAVWLRYHEIGKGDDNA